MQGHHAHLDWAKEQGHRKEEQVARKEEKANRKEGKEDQKEQKEVQELQLVPSLHLQGAPGGSPRHSHLIKGDINRELDGERHLREIRRRGRDPLHAQQEVHCHRPRDTDGGPINLSSRTRQTRNV